MTERHHGRLEGLLLSVVVTAAAALSVGGFWRVSQVAEIKGSEACAQLANSHKDTLAQVISLALALVALRRVQGNGQDPPA